MRKNKKLFAILTLVAFMMTLMPVLAFGATGDAKVVSDYNLDTANSGKYTITSTDGTNIWESTDYTVGHGSTSTWSHIGAKGSVTLVAGRYYIATEDGTTNPNGKTIGDSDVFTKAIADAQIVTVDELEIVAGTGENAGKIAFKITDNTGMRSSVNLQVTKVDPADGNLDGTVVASATTHTNGVATTGYINAPALGTVYGIKAKADGDGTSITADGTEPDDTVPYDAAAQSKVQRAIDFVIDEDASDNNWVDAITVTVGDDIKTAAQAGITGYTVSIANASDIDASIRSYVSMTGNNAAQDLMGEITAPVSGTINFTVTKTGNALIVGKVPVTVTINPAAAAATTVQDVVNAMGTQSFGLTTAGGDKTVTLNTPIDPSVTVRAESWPPALGAVAPTLSGSSLTINTNPGVAGNYPITFVATKTGEQPQRFTITLKIGTPSNADASVEASIIATVDANANIESNAGATDTNSGSWLDTKYAELDLVFRGVNNASADRTKVYIWAEESGRSNQASDAFVLNVGAPVAGYLSSPANPADHGQKVYEVPANALSAGSNTLKAAFLRGGTYTIKASFANPTEKVISDNNGNRKVVSIQPNESLTSVATLKTVSGKTTITVTSPAQESRLFTIDVAYGANNKVIATKLGDGKTTADAVPVAADTVATTKVTITVKNKTGSIMSTYPVRLSTNSANIELDKTSVSTDYKGEASFNVAGIREGEYKIYVTIGDYEGTIKVQVGATSANDIQLIKFPSNPIATDTLVTDYKDIFRFQLTDANGNIVTGHNPRGARYASLDSTVPASEKTTAEMAKYAYIVSAPEANKVKNADLKLLYVDKPTNKDYYTLGIDNNKAFEAEGDYEIRVVLDNGKSATLNFSVKKFDKATSLHIEYPTSAVELNSTTAVPDIYFLDANNVMKKANNRVIVAAQGYAVASVEKDGDEAGKLTIKNDEKYVGQTITVTAASDKENLMASTTLTVADQAREVKLDTNRGPVNANNRVGFKVIDSTGNAVALGNDATVEITAVVTNTGDADAKVSYSVTSSSKADLREKGTGIINLSANKQTTATVQIMVKVEKPLTNADDNNTGLSTTYYSGTETFTFGAEADKSVVMTIGSKEIVAQNVPVTIDVAPFIQDNRTYVPFRALVEAFGAEVDYNADNNTVTTKLDGKTVVLTVGSTVLTVNDETVTMDVAPFIVDDRVVVPVRFVGEAFGFTVEATQDADTGATASVVFYQK